MGVKAKKDYLRVYCHAVFVGLLVYLVAGSGYLFFVRASQLNRATVAQGRILSLVGEQRSANPNFTTENFRGKVNRLFEDYQQLLQVVSFRDEASEKILNRFRRASYDDQGLDISALRKSLFYLVKWDYVNLERDNRVISIESIYYVLPQNLVYQVVQIGFYLCIFFFLLTVFVLLLQPKRNYSERLSKVDGTLAPPRSSASTTGGDSPPKGKNNGASLLGSPQRGSELTSEEILPENDADWLENAFNFDEETAKVDPSGSSLRSSEAKGSSREWDFDLSQDLPEMESESASSNPLPSEDEGFFTPESEPADVPTDFALDETSPPPGEEFDLTGLSQDASSPLFESEAQSSEPPEGEKFTFGTDDDSQKFDEEFADVSAQTTDELFDFFGDVPSQPGTEGEVGAMAEDDPSVESDNMEFLPELTDAATDGETEEEPFPDSAQAEDPGVEEGEYWTESDSPTDDTLNVDDADESSEFSLDTLPVSNVDEADLSETISSPMLPVDREPDLGELFDRSEEGEPSFDDADDAWERVLIERSPQLDANIASLLEAGQPFSLALLTAEEPLDDLLKQNFDDENLLYRESRQTVMTFPGFVLPLALERMQTFASENKVAGLRCGLSGYVPTRAGLDVETLLEEARYAWLSADEEKPIGAYSGV